MLASACVLSSLIAILLSVLFLFILINFVTNTIPIIQTVIDASTVVAVCFRLNCRVVFSQSRPVILKCAHCSYGSYCLLALPMASPIVFATSCSANRSLPSRLATIRLARPSPSVEQQVSLWLAPRQSRQCHVVIAIVFLLIYDDYCEHCRHNSEYCCYCCYHGCSYACSCYMFV